MSCHASALGIWLRRLAHRSSRNRVSCSSSSRCICPWGRAGAAGFANELHRSSPGVARWSAVDSSGGQLPVFLMCLLGCFRIFGLCRLRWKATLMLVQECDSPIHFEHDSLLGWTSDSMLPWVLSMYFPVVFFLDQYISRVSCPAYRRCPLSCGLHSCLYYRWKSRLLLPFCSLGAPPGRFGWARRFGCRHRSQSSLRSFHLGQQRRPQSYLDRGLFGNWDGPVQLVHQTMSLN